MKWYFERGAGQEGPVNEEEIRAMVADATLGLDNRVWCKDLADWTAVALLPDLHPAPAPPSEPEPEPEPAPLVADPEPVVTEPTGLPRAELGSVVWAEWTENDWYRGRIDRVDGEDALNVAFDDGDEATVSRSKIALDSAPEAEHVHVGSRVLASWWGSLYPAAVSSIEGDTYKVAFDDGAKGKSKLKNLKLIGR